MRPIAQSSSPPDSDVMAAPPTSSKPTRLEEGCEGEGNLGEGGDVGERERERGEDSGDAGEGEGESGGEGGDASSVISPMVTSAPTSTLAPAALAAALPKPAITVEEIFGRPPTQAVSGMAAKTTTEPDRSVRITVDASTLRLEARLSVKAWRSKLATSPLTCAEVERGLKVR